MTEKPISDFRDPISGVTRRRFAQLAVAAAAVLPSALSAQEVPAQPQQPQLSAAAQAEVDARIAWIFGRYGSRLDNAQRADIRRLVTGSYSGFEQMRAYPLENGVEPSTVFRVWRAAPRRAFVPKVERKS